MGTKKLTLMGSVEQGECKFIKGKKLQRLTQSEGGKIAKMYSIQAWEWDGIKAEGKREEQKNSWLISNALELY